jgi:hypothetical protein
MKRERTVTDTAADRQRAVLEAIQILRQEVLELLPAESANSLMVELAEALRDADSHVGRPMAIARAEEAIARYPKAHRRLEEILLGTEDTRIKYQGPPGPPQGIRPMLMACPKDPTHYQKYARIAGQRLRCPQHQVDLIPYKDVGS